MTETLFLSIVVAGFAVFIGVLAWAQVTTPTRTQHPGGDSRDGM